MPGLPILCTNCRHPYPPAGAPYRCPVCGGIFDFQSDLEFDPKRIELSRPGIWRYWHTFHLPEEVEPVSLGEGTTPLVWGKVGSHRVAFKCEFQNPTGSFKDRGSALIASFLLHRGVREAVEDSSGNAGASFAAYAARGGIKARIFVPDSASGPKRWQIEAYGAELVRVMGPRSNAAQAVQRTAEQGAVYASHAAMPFNLPGYATVAYEIVEQIGNEPGAVFIPVGQGGLLLGIGRGFLALHKAGVIQSLPVLVAVQARACAPLWALHSYGLAGMNFVTESPTVAEGIRVRHPLRGDTVLQWLERNRGLIVAVDEADILEGRDQLSKQGFYVEATSGVIWKPILDLAEQIPGPIVAVLTGSGLKTTREIT
jgi:threonine synthase